MTTAEERTQIIITSPVGSLRLRADERGRLAEIAFCDDDDPQPTAEDAAVHSVLVETRRQLAEYFAGERLTFDLALGPVGSEFQLAVWEALTKVPYAATASYGEIARRVVGDVTASRAIGAANGQNPLPIVVPCHRVIGASGNLTGYAGGLERKKTLLQLEARVELEQAFGPKLAERS